MEKLWTHINARSNLLATLKKKLKKNILYNSQICDYVATTVIRNSQKQVENKFQNNLVMQ